MGRHRAGGSGKDTAPYVGAGKRKRVADPPPRRTSGRHKHPGRRVAAPRTAPAIRLAGVATVAGAVGLTIAASGVGSETPVHETAMTAGVRPESPPRRDPAVSRSAQRADLPDTDAEISRLVAQRAQALRGVERQARQYARELASNRWVLPMASYRLTGTFGETSYLWSTVHTGVDFAAPDGTDIRAVAAGEVTDAGWAGSYGYRTIVELDDGTEIWYCHQSSIGVAVGDQVARGQVIGDVGSTGNVTGPHLHLEVRPGGGDPVDPAVALAEHDAAP